MSWEVRIMRSKTSFFNLGLAKNLLRRSWPFWFCYLALLMLSFPVSLYNVTHNWRGTWEELIDFKANWILSNGCWVAVLSFFACIIAAMIVFSYLYNSRTCGLVCSLPLRRGTVFCTAYLTGLLPLLAADLLTALATWIVFGRYTAGGLIAKWMGLAVMGNIAFYGFAVFCAMLTGSLFILPLVYAVLNAAAFVAESALVSLLGVFIYGFAENGVVLRKLSPAVELATRLYVLEVSDRTAIIGEKVYRVEGFSTLAAYCAAGLILSFCAFLLYRKRRMETAGDTVSIPVLKPLFKYCMAFGTALVFAALLTQEFFSQAFRGTKLAVLAALLLLAGAFIGYYVAEMLIQKTMRVFGGGWRGMVVVWCILLIFSLVCEGNITGYETRFPDPGEIEKAELSVYAPSTLKEEANIASLIEIHRGIVEQKKLNEAADKKLWITLRYMLKNGKTMVRNYALPYDGQKPDYEDSSLSLLQDLSNVPEAILSRHEMQVEVKPENIEYCEVLTYHWDEEMGGLNGETIRLSAETASNLYWNALLPDMEEGRLGRDYFYDSEIDDLRSDTSVSMSLSLKDNNRAMMYDWKDFSVQLDSERTIAWLAKNLQLAVQPYPEEAYTYPKEPYSYEMDN